MFNRSSTPAKRSFCLRILICFLLGIVPLRAAEPLHVFIRAGVKTHGPNQHDHPRFLKEWTALLSERGLKVEGALEFPSAAQLDKTDVLVIYAQDGMKVVGEQRANFERFLKRGGGIVVVHDGVVSGDEHDWAKKVQGGAWRWDGDKKTKWFEGEVGVYFVDTAHPITRGLSNFDWKDEIYYDLDMSPDARVLATSFHSVFVIAPQLWTYEQTWEGGTTPYRAFVSLPGHEFDSFNTSHYRAILLRGIAWAGKRSNIDEFCKPDEVSEVALRYPVGGPTRPEQAAAKLVVHPEFTLNLIAAEPLIEKVISLDWAPDGKLWVAETPEYPGGRTINRNDAVIFPNRTRTLGANSPREEPRAPKDRISWLDDPDATGRLQKKHVFYEGLERVTSFVFYKDGVIVEQAPDILWLRDTDGDGKADKVEKLYTGFGTSDTHAVINNMRWGRDGWLYSAVGYSAGDPKSGDGSKSFGRITAGIIRFKPDGSMLEQVASGSCNTWGFDFAPDGEMFYTTATCGEHLLHIVMPEKALARGNVGGGIRASAVIPDHQKVAPLVHHTRPAYMQIDWVGMFTAAAGSCIYDGGVWPERWNHMHFLEEPTVSLVHNDVIYPKDTTYVAKKEQGREDSEFLAGSDLWFRPIHARVGPDGALYVVDWYNQAVIHNDTRGPAHGAHNAATRPDRDHHFARIWRVQHKQALRLPVLALDTSNHVAWLNALASPNGWMRMTAHRLLSERGDESDAKALVQLLHNSEANALTRMHALYVLENLGHLEGDYLVTALRDHDPILRKNALRISAERDNSGIEPDRGLVKALINDPDPRARLNALVALATFDQSANTAAEVIAAWPSLNDPYLQSAAIGCAARDPLLFEEAALAVSDSAPLTAFASHVARLIANQQKPQLAAQLIDLLAKPSDRGEPIRLAVLESLAANLRSDTSLVWDPRLQSALTTLLHSQSPAVASATLPLIARWDKNGAISGELKPLIGELLSKLQNASLSDDQRGKVVVNLVGVHKQDAQIIPKVAALLAGNTSSSLQQKIIETLGSSGDAAAGTELLAAYSRVPDELHDAVFGQIIKRAEWSLALLQALADQKIDSRVLGPANLHRLRTHADRAVASKANEVLDTLRGPVKKEKDALIAQLRPVVEQSGGDVAEGHKLFTANCAVCHKFNDEGRDLAPNLTGMGAHGPAELLVHIVDPNRLVEPNFFSTSIETKDDLSYDGIIARENRSELVLRNASGDFTIPKNNIRGRRATGLSLMPEGFETLGGRGLRDLLSYLGAGEQRFRILNLASAFTVNTGKGVYLSTENASDAPEFSQYGIVKAGDVPFEIVSPQKAAANAVVLKGGQGYAKTLPQRVELKVGLAAQRLHFLSGIAGWGWPSGGESTKNLPALRAVLHFNGGASQELVFRNGVEFADWIGQNDVPGSKGLPQFAKRGQIRTFSKEVDHRDPIESITLESFNNEVAPTVIGITAELALSGEAPAGGANVFAGGSASAQLPPDAAEKAGIRALIIGAGSSHDFNRWFLEKDSQTLARFGQIQTTSKPDALSEFIKDLNVLYLSNNAPFTNPANRSAIMDFANSGKGLLLVHPALWYNWADWPEFNRVLCGGGSRGHDALAEFEVTITEPNHPLVQGLPAKFKIRDELYWFQTDSQGTPIKVLATAHSPSKNKDFPMIFVVEHPKARIAAIALGHDGAAHELPAYQRLLQNALRWTASKQTTP
jgi:putative membrane-bound dehydrogenase-like protein